MRADHDLPEGARDGRGGPDPWVLWLPEGLHAGLHAAAADDPSGLLEAGENWAGAEHVVPDHAHPGWELYLQRHGASTWDVDGRELRLAAGWLLAVPPGVRHRSVARTGARHHFAYASFDLARLAARRPELAAEWRRGGREPLVTPHGRALEPAFGTLVRELGEQRPHGAVALEAALDLLLVEAVRALLAPAPPEPRIPRHPAVARALHLLDTEHARPWTVDDLAAACALSRAHLTALFTAEVGRPPHAHLVHRRVERAGELLRGTDRTVAEVAAEVGFSSRAQLSRAFSRVLGTTPRAWRREAQPSSR